MEEVKLSKPDPKKADSAARKDSQSSSEHDDDSSNDSRLERALMQSALSDGHAYGIEGATQQQDVLSTTKLGESTQERPLRDDECPQTPPPIESSAVASYFNPYSHHNVSRFSVPRSHIGERSSIWMESPHSSPMRRDAADREEMTTGSLVEVERQDSYDSQDSVDSAKELERIAMEIRSEIRRMEILELAEEAERAAEAGQERFAGRASTFGDDSDPSLHVPIADGPVSKPDKLRRFHTFSSYGGKNRLLAQRSILVPRLAEQKIRVLSLRNVNEVIPPFAELQMHLRTHLASNGVDQRTLLKSIGHEKHETKERHSLSRRTPDRMIRDLASWVTHVSSCDGQNVGNEDLSLHTPPHSPIRHVHGDISSPNSIIDGSADPSPVSSEEVGPILAGHLHSPPPAALKQKPSPVQIPEGLVFSDYINKKDRADCGTTLTTVPTSSSSDVDANPNKKSENSTPTSTPPATSDIIHPKALFHSPEHGRLNASHDRIEVVDASSGVNRDSVPLNVFDTPERLRGIKQFRDLVGDEHGGDEGDTNSPYTPHFEEGGCSIVRACGTNPFSEAESPFRRPLQPRSETYPLVEHFEHVDFAAAGFDSVIDGGSAVKDTKSGSQTWTERHSEEPHIMTETVDKSLVEDEGDESILDGARSPRESGTTASPKPEVDASDQIMVPVEKSRAKTSLADDQKQCDPESTAQQSDPNVVIDKSESKTSPNPGEEEAEQTFFPIESLRAKCPLADDLKRLEPDSSLEQSDPNVLFDPIERWRESPFDDELKQVSESQLESTNPPLAHSEPGNAQCSEQGGSSSRHFSSVEEWREESPELPQNEIDDAILMNESERDAIVAQKSGGQSDSVRTPPGLECQCFVTSASSLESLTPPRSDKNPQVQDEKPVTPKIHRVFSLPNLAAERYDIQLAEDVLPVQSPGRRAASEANTSFKPAASAMDFISKSLSHFPRAISPKKSPSSRRSASEAGSNTSFTAAMVAMDVLRSFAPHKKDTSTPKGVSKEWEELYIPAHENHDFLNNYLYCSKLPESPDNLEGHTGMGGLCEHPCMIGGDGEVSCEALSGALSTALESLPTRTQRTNADGGVRPRTASGVGRLGPDRWFDVASAKVDGALERLVGSSNATWKMFQAPSLKKKTRSGVSSPSRKNPVIILRQDTLSSNSLNDHSESTMPDLQFESLYGMTRDEFAELPVTERTQLHDSLMQRGLLRKNTSSMMQT